MRVFIAALLPKHIKREIASFIDGIKPSIDGVKWETEEKLHITLKFLGDIETPKQNDINELMVGITKAHSPINTSFSEFSGFPNLRNPRVLVVELSEDTKLMDLQTQVENGLHGLGFDKDKRKFRSHVTVGRVKKKYPSPRDFPALTKTPFTINEIAVVKSELTPGGSIYTPISIFRLGD